MDISAIQKQITNSAGDSSLPPVEKWNPAFCGNMNLVIKRNGQWWHEGTPFTRAALIRLLSSVIKKEGEDYFLVTPVEKIGIQVEDVPFIIVDDELGADDEGHEYIEVSTSCGDKVKISEKNPIEIREFEGNGVPYCLIRLNLWARVHQNVLYRWVDSASEETFDGVNSLFLTSGTYRFSIGSF